MRNTLIGNLPRHLYVWVDTAFTHKEPQGFVRAVWFGLVSYPGRMWGCNVLLEQGAVYRSLPPHALAFTDKPREKRWSPQQAQRWDCYGWDFSVLEYDYLAGLDCLVRVGGSDTIYHGRYLFTVAPVGDAFSAAPEQAKEFAFIATEDRLTIQPSDKVIYRERSFTGGKVSFPSGLRRQTEVYSCE